MTNPAAKKSFSGSRFLAAFCAGILTCLITGIQPARAAVGINPQINFQGKLVTASGTNVTDGSQYEMIFSLYNVSSGGSSIWTETQSNLTVASGIFQAALGSVASMASVDFNNDTIYLGITISKDAFGSTTSETEMSPRIRLTAVPYAFNAKTVGGLTVTPNGGNTLNIAAGKTLTVSNTVTIAGTDGNTYTLPAVSGGTILTSNQTSQTVNSAQTTGTVITIGAAAPVTLTGILTGQSIDLSTNYTATNQSQTGLNVTLDGGTNTNTSGTVYYRGLQVSAGAAYIQNGGGGTTNINGLDITNPNITQTAGTIAASGLNVITGSVTTAGTQNGVNITATGVGAGSLNALNISGITPGAGAETGLSVGQGWDSAVKVAAPAAFTQTTALTGITLDYTTNFTAASGRNITGINMTMPAITATTATSYTGLNLGTAGAAVSNGGNYTFAGLNVVTPNITQTANTAAASGLIITTGTITTGGTQTGISIAVGSAAAGTVNAISVGNASGASTSKTALAIGTGWDTGVNIGSGGIAITGQTVFGARVNSQNLTTTQTVNDSTKANVFHLSNTTGASGGVTPTVTFNLNGVTNTDGTVLFLTVQAIKAASTPASTSQVNVTINGGANVFTANVTTGSSTGAVTSTKNVILTRINSVWKYQATETTSNQAADLAEWIEYTNSKPAPGELVSIKGGSLVSQSPIEYDSRVAGIVSTRPHTILGLQTQKSIAMALSGRVPAIVTLINGEINVGDPISSSPLAGVGMTPTRETQIVGKAMENFDVNDIPKCIPVINYNSIPWPDDDGTNAQKPCYAIPVSSLDTTTKSILAQKYLLTELDKVYIGKVMVLVNLSYAKPYSKLAGLEFNDRSGEAAVDDLADGLARVITVVNGEATISGNLTVKGAGAFGALLTVKNLVTNQLSEFLGKVIFHQDTKFLGAATFNNDTAGFAAIKSGQDHVDIVFGKEFVKPPVPNVNLIVLTVTPGMKGYADKGYEYYVTNLTGKGFTIQLNKTASDEVDFTWLVMQVDSAKTVTNPDLPTPTTLPTSTAAPTPTPGTPTITVTPTPIPTPTGAITPTLQI